MIWLMVLAIGLSSGFGYLVWFHAIESLPATLVAGFLALSPITAFVLSLILLDAAVTPSLLIATALVCSGIVCFARSNPHQ
ncbi:EamA family transporter [Tabrizicola piscis]|nr:EamA family transporter [Tabrizicola piscis]